MDSTSSSGIRDRRLSERSEPITTRPQPRISDLPTISRTPSPSEGSAVSEEQDVPVISYPPNALSAPHVYERSSSLHIPPKSTSLSPGTTPGTLTPALTRTNEPLIELEPRAERHSLRLVSAFLSFFTCGWADGTPGTIIPHLESTYQLSHFKVSTIFIAATIGFGIGTFLNEPLIIQTGQFSLESDSRVLFPPFLQKIVSRRWNSSKDASAHSVPLGRLWTVLFGCACQIIYYSIAISNPSFAALCFAFCLGGIAVSLFAGQMNAYVAAASQKRNQGRELGYLHGCYGLGAFASPLICQTVLAAGWTWHRFYWTSLGFSLLNTVLMATAFHPTKNEWEVDRETGLSKQEMERRTSEKERDSSRNEIEAQAVRKGLSGRRTKPKGTMWLALKMPYVWLFMAFLGIYMGSETTTGGWIVTYLLRQRNANPDTVGYVASGFWGGVAAGRIMLGHVSPYLGLRREKHLVHVYIVLSLVMTLIIWFVPSFVGNAICTAFMGLFLGPIFPTS
ncbi:hypothetical protein FRB90_009594 [Tulasnella sp. 427]|nr:hypothetical protein FRB90_009594 [Tulasnella sp. 427]